MRAVTSTLVHMEQLVLDLTNPQARENALLELSKKRESFPELAPYLWHSFGTVSALLQEIVAIYPLLSPPSLTAHASNRVCNALALLQCVASHPETRSLFLQGVFYAAALVAPLPKLALCICAVCVHKLSKALTLLWHRSVHTNVPVPVLEYHQQNAAF